MSNTIATHNIFIFILFTPTDSINNWFSQFVGKITITVSAPFYLNNSFVCAINQNRWTLFSIAHMDIWCRDNCRIQLHWLFVVHGQTNQTIWMFVETSVCCVWCCSRWQMKVLNLWPDGELSWIFLFVYLCAHSIRIRNNAETMCMQLIAWIQFHLVMNIMFLYGREFFRLPIHLGVFAVHNVCHRNLNPTHFVTSSSVRPSNLFIHR